jgi:hypothetical protein
MTCSKSSACSPVQSYRRQRDLPRLLPLWPHEVATATLGEHARLLARLRRALRIERRRGLSGHWAYDLARHAQLLRAYRCETADYLARMRQQRSAAAAAD